MRRSLLTLGIGTLLLAACGGPSSGADAIEAAGPDQAVEVDLDEAGEPPGCGDGVLGPDEACDADARPCVDLGASFESGVAPCRADCSGYDTQGCRIVSDETLWEAVSPGLRDPVRWGTARCNDGTPFTFRVRLSPTGSRTWVIALRGGGLCDDDALPCWVRPRELTTALPQVDRQLHVPDDKTGGVFSRDAVANPAWADANQVFGFYCSSDAWTGLRAARVATTASADGWYFSGRLNARAMLEAVIADYGLDDGDPATRVLWAGESAGCVGALATVDLVAAALPATTASGRLQVLLDAAWLVSDWDDPEARLGLADASDRDVVRRAVDFWGGRPGGRCASAVVAGGGHVGDCLFGAVALPFLQQAPPAGLGLSVMVQQSLQDEELLTFHGLLDDPEGIADYAARSLAELEEAPWLFAADVAYHSTLFKGDAWTLGAPGSTLGEVLAAFWVGSAPRRVVYRP